MNERSSQEPSVDPSASAPENFDALGASAFSGDVDSLRDLLAMPDLNTDTRAQAERVLATLFIKRSLSLLPDLMGIVYAHWPLGFRRPEVRGALHLALETEAIRGQDLVRTLQPLFSVGDRLAELLHLEAAAPLGARLRVANVAKGVAIAARSADGLDRVLPVDTHDLFLRTLVRLFADRDLDVAMRAAWSVGLLARRQPQLEALLASASLNRHHGLARRAMIGRVAQFIAGDIADDDECLATPNAHSDRWMQSSVIHALRFGLNTAPKTTTDHLEYILGHAPNVDTLREAARFAYELDPSEEREKLIHWLRELRTTLKRPDLELDFWLDPQPAVEDAILRQYKALKEQLRQSIRDAHDISGALLSQISEAIERFGPKTHKDERARLEIALDYVLLETTLVRDAAQTSGGTKEEKERRRKLGHLSIAALRDARIQELRGPFTTEAAYTEQLRLVSRVLDAMPRNETGAPREFSNDFETSTREAAVLLHSCFDSSKPQYFRPLARALVSAVEPLIASGAVLSTDLICSLLSTTSPKFIDAVGEATLVSELGICAAKLAALARLFPSHEQEPAPLETRVQLVEGLRELSEAASRLAHAESNPLVAGLRSLWTASRGLLPAAANTTVVPLFNAWTVAVSQLFDAQRMAAKRLGMHQPTLPSASKVEAAFRGLFVSTSFAHQRDEARVDAAVKQATSLLPTLLRPLLPILVKGRIADAQRNSAATPKQAPRQEKRTIGDYEVISKLGGGAMGECLLVRQRTRRNAPPGPVFVLKLPCELAYVNLFREEALALLRLRNAPHPAIVRFISFTDSELTQPFLVMEYVAGPNIEHVLETRKQPAFTVEEVRQIGATLAAGLSCAHSLNMAHFDIKPANIVLAENDSTRTAVLVDWGLAGAGGIIAGSPLYMAPERHYVHGPENTQAPFAADVFSLGCVLYEMLTGRMLLDPHLILSDGAGFEGDVGIRDVAAMEHVFANRIDRDCPHADATLRSALKRMVLKSPQHRSSMGEIAQLLETTSRTG